MEGFSGLQQRWRTDFNCKELNLIARDRHLAVPFSFYMVFLACGVEKPGKLWYNTLINHKMEWYALF